jgi:hypothetical protein
MMPPRSFFFSSRKIIQFPVLKSIRMIYKGGFPGDLFIFSVIFLRWYGVTTRCMPRKIEPLLKIDHLGPGILNSDKYSWQLSYLEKIHFMNDE